MTKPKRTSHRSGGRAVNVSYADNDSDIDLENDGSESEKSDDDESQSGADEFDDLLDSLSKQPKADPKPESKNTTDLKAKEANRAESHRNDEDVVFDSGASSDETIEVRNKVNKALKQPTKRRQSHISKMPLRVQLSKMMKLLPMIVMLVQIRRRRQVIRLLELLKLPIKRI